MSRRSVPRHSANYGRRKHFCEAPALQFYGLERARAEGWTLLRYPVLAAAPERSIKALQSLREAGAVIVDCQQQVRHYSENHERVWWFGLPPAGLDAPLEEIARAAGMLGKEPLTFRWFPVAQKVESAA